MAQILVVDDDEALRKLVVTVLSAAGHSARPATGPDEALAICADPSIPIDLVVADVVMPKLSGRHLASQIAEIRPHIPILLMSGYPSLSGVLDVMATRSERTRTEFDFIQKPFTPSELVAKVRSVLTPPEKPAE